MSIEVDEPVAWADRAVHLTVSGLDPGEPVVVWAQATDYNGELWRASATFEADSDGVGTSTGTPPSPAATRARTRWACSGP